MAEPPRPRWTVAEFFAWQDRQSGRYELVNGEPVRMMAGARNVHDDIVVNLLTELRQRLRGSGCRPFSGDGAVETYPGQIRRPDVGVDCGRREPDAMKASLPRLVIEVLSPSTRDFDAFGKLEEYKALESLECIAFVEPNAPQIAVWERGDARAWRSRIVSGLDAALELPALGLSLPLAEVYDGVVFAAR